MPTPIPQPPGLPFLGNLFDLNSNDTWGSFKRLSDKYGPIFKIQVLGKQIVVVGNTSLAAEVCDEKRFRKCTGAASFLVMREAVHDALFTASDHEPSWGIAHRIMTPLIAPSSDDVRVKELQEMASELVAKWSSGTAQPERVHVTEDTKRLTVQSAIYHFFNQRHNLLGGKGPAVVELLDQISWEMVQRSSRPKLLTWLFYNGVYEKQIRDFRKIAADFMAAKRAEKTPKQDMLQALLTAKDPETGESLDEERVIDEIITIAITSNTAAGLISFVLYYLLKNPEEMAKARREIDAVLGSNSQITAQDLSKLPYLDAILMETLRLSATAPGFLVEPIPSDNAGVVMLAGDKYQIPKDQTVIVLLAAVNRDPDVYEDPEAFRPERMMGEAFEKLPPGAKKWFGNGKRSCFGKRFALQLTMITLVEILRNFNLEMADPNYQLKTTSKEIGAFFRSPVGFYALTSPRKNPVTAE
ncbi:NADPH cytochrome P450 [Arthroderma uncinatum]|uniref:NADPH cytochrome P450 n=1 Tax=Arthroderma uncinatum TaxID=74035 RepID=UPI00144A8463|nr:NADPH cytochrome P450 [Arthroderma uncinatum]KAF3481177.1 NADPH cytochrome P450 [Arthroderma uncinatum]